MRPLVLLAVLGFATLCPALHGVISQDTVWSDTVRVDGDVVIASGATLRVTAGTRIRFDSTSTWDTLRYYPNKVCDIFVMGRLVARGTAQDSIRFFPASAYHGWGGLDFSGSVGDTLEYAVIADFAVSGVQMDSSEVCIWASTVAGIADRWSSESVIGIDGRASRLSLEHSRVAWIWTTVGDATGLRLRDCPGVSISSTRIEKCHGGDWIDFTGGGDGVGVDAWNCLLKMADCTIADVSPGTSPGPYGIGAGIRYADTTGQGISSTVERCRFLRCWQYAAISSAPYSLDVRGNFWGTTVEADLRRGLNGRLSYSPWVDSAGQQTFYTSALSGDITSDSTWRGHIQLGGDVRVDAGATLTIVPGCVVEILPGKMGWGPPGLDYLGETELVIEGTLNAQGSHQDSIVFRGTTDKDAWGGIWLAGTSRGSLRFVSVGQARTGITCISCSPAIESSSVHDCRGWGANMSMGEPGFGEPGIGILCRNASPMMRQVRISDCLGGLGDVGTSMGGPTGGNGIGILCTGQASPMIAECAIRRCIGGNATFSNYGGPGNGIGVLCADSSAPAITSTRIADCWGGAQDRGNLGTAFGIGADVFCQPGSHPKLVGSRTGYNRFEGASRFRVRNETPDSIDATWNWWGTLNRDSIAQHIYDHEDDPQYGIVLFEPFVDSLGDTLVPPPPPPPPDTVHPDTVYHVTPTVFGSYCLVRYGVTAQMSVKVSVYDATGKRIRTLEDVVRKPGVYYVNWLGDDDRGRPVGAGAYFCRFQTADRVRVVKLVKLE